MCIFDGMRIEGNDSREALDDAVLVLNYTTFFLGASLGLFVLLGRGVLVQSDLVKQRGLDHVV